MKDNPRSDIALAMGHRFSQKSKALQIQVLADATKGSDQAVVNFGDAYQGWFCVAPPPIPTKDAKGTISGATEFLTSEVADQHVMHGSRDVRVAKFAQDVKAGEFALLNELGFRLFVGKDTVALVAGGGFLNFDVKGKKVGLTGIPSTAGAPVPYLAIDTTSIGMVSASGAASFSLSDAQATISGSSVSIDAGRVDLGKGASDPVVTYSQLVAVLAQVLAQLNVWAVQYNTHLPPPIPANIMAPLVVVAIPGRRVFAPAF